jgi:hypothetical protein
MASLLIRLPVAGYPFTDVAVRLCRVSLAPVRCGWYNSVATQNVLRAGSNLWMKTIEYLLELTGVSRMEVAARSGLGLARIEAIADGRWTPTPEERERVAAAFDVPVEEISWGHTVNPRNVRYRRFGLKDSF